MTPQRVSADTLPFFGNMKTRCAKCGATRDILVAYCPGCAQVAGEHYHRRCMTCRQGWAEQTEAQPKPLTVRLRGHDVELTCVCTFTLVQPLRAVIADECPKCRRSWRR
jgi:hypothetical protein